MSFGTSSDPFPLLVLSTPITTVIFEGFLNTSQGYWLSPKWLAPDERGMMPGAPPSMASLRMLSRKGLHQTHMRTHADSYAQTASKDPTQHFGRHIMKSYKALGYLPDDFHESVSLQLQIMLMICIANVAKHLAYRNSRSLVLLPASPTGHDAQTSFMRARSTNGNFKEPFSYHSWEEIMQNVQQLQAT